MGFGNWLWWIVFGSGSPYSQSHTSVPHLVATVITTSTQLQRTFHCYQNQHVLYIISPLCFPRHRLYYTWITGGKLQHKSITLIQYRQENHASTNAHKNNYSGTNKIRSQPSILFITDASDFCPIHECFPRDLFTSPFWTKLLNALPFFIMRAKKNPPFRIISVTQL